MILGFCRPLASGFANDIQVQCPMLLCVWLQFEFVCDDPRNTVLAASTTFSLFSLEGKEMGKLANTVEIASFDVEMK